MSTKESGRKSYLGEKSLINVTLCEVYIFKLYEWVQLSVMWHGCLVNSLHTAREVKQKCFAIVKQIVKTFFQMSLSILSSY